MWKTPEVNPLTFCRYFFQKSKKNHKCSNINVIHCISCLLLKKIHEKKFHKFFSAFYKYSVNLGNVLCLTGKIINHNFIYFSWTKIWFCENNGISEFCYSCPLHFSVEKSSLAVYVINTQTWLKILYTHQQTEKIFLI